MSFLRGLGGGDPSAAEVDPARRGRPEQLSLRAATTRVATGTLACPSCDVPVTLDGPTRPQASLSCPFCGTSGPLRSFLTLGEPTRPTRVVVRVGLRG